MVYLQKPLLDIKIKQGGGEENMTKYQIKHRSYLTMVRLIIIFVLLLRLSRRGENEG